MNMTYLHHGERQQLRGFDIEVFVYLALALAITLLRTYARVSTSGWKGLGPDDYLAWVGMIFQGVDTYLSYSIVTVAHGMANNGMGPAYRASIKPDQLEYQLRVTGSKLQLVNWTTYSVLIWALKASMCCLLLRLTEGINMYRRRVYAGLGFIAISWVAVILTLFLSCRPLYKMWQIYPDPGVYCEPAVSPAIIFTVLALSVSTDLYLMFIPVSMFFRTSFPVVKKTGLICLFGCGVFVAIAAILRSVLTLEHVYRGEFLSCSWAIRESFVAVVAANLPLMFPLFNRWLSPIISSVTSRLDTKRRSDECPSTTGEAVTIGRIGMRTPARGSLEDLSGMEFSTISDDLEMTRASPRSTHSTWPLTSGAESETRVQKAFPGITRKVSLHITSEQVDPSSSNSHHSVRGNFTLTSGPSGNPVETPTRSSFFGDHVHQDGYSFV